MKTPVHITFRDMPVIDAIEAACWEAADTLTREFDEIAECHVMIASIGSSSVAIRLHVNTGHSGIVVHRAPDDRVTNDPIGDALRQTFEDMRRRLQQAHRSAG